MSRADIVTGAELLQGFSHGFVEGVALSRFPDMRSTLAGSGTNLLAIASLSQEK